ALHASGGNLLLRKCEGLLVDTFLFSVHHLILPFLISEYMVRAVDSFTPCAITAATKASRSIPSSHAARHMDFAVGAPLRDTGRRAWTGAAAFGKKRESSSRSIQASSASSRFLSMNSFGAIMNHSPLALL